jgi:hypothetical protein
MERQIFLEENGRLGYRSTRILYGFVGTIFSVNGVSTIVRSDGPMFPAFGILLVGAGVYYLAVALFLMRKKGPFMPRVELHGEKLVLKSRLLSKTQEILQDNITRVSFDTYKLRFYMQKGERVFDYATKPEISIQLKEAIRLWCEERNIPVEDG